MIDLENKECLHAYMLFNGKNITEAHLYDLYYETGFRDIPYISEIIDRRKNYAEHYKYCPYCGSKLDYKHFRKMVYATIDALNGGVIE